jgi:hypothetical protein
VPAVTRAPQAPNAPVVQSAPLVAETVDARFARLRNYHQIDPISLTEEQKALEEKQRNGMHACLYVCMYMKGKCSTMYLVSPLRQVWFALSLLIVATSSAVTVINTTAWAERGMILVLGKRCPLVDISKLRQKFGCSSGCFASFWEWSFPRWTSYFLQLLLLLLLLLSLLLLSLLRLFRCYCFRFCCFFRCFASFWEWSFCDGPPIFCSCCSCCSCCFNFNSTPLQV